MENTLRSHGIPFHLLQGDPIVTVPSFVREHGAIALVCDFSPVRVPSMWVKEIAEIMQTSSSSLSEPQYAKPIPMIQIDAHNVIPCWHASPKVEYGARTLRGKMSKVMSEYLIEDFCDFDAPSISTTANAKTALALKDCPPVNWTAVLASLSINRDVKEVDWLMPGTAGAWQMLRSFCEKKLDLYAEKRNDPNIDACSDMSPYYHFGHISVQRAILYIKSLRKHANGGTDAYIEEAIVRRELADNFCYYNANYDNLHGIHDWAKESLNIHKADKRTVIYTREQFELGQSHEDLWNAAQLQMVNTGKMHGFLRMYWAKKILEWSPTPEEALSTAIYLNDKYQLDGRDPNGYVGCMWSIGGIHDQGWMERTIFGKIRYMNYDGCKRKFDVSKFVNKFPPSASNAKKAAARYASTGTIGSVVVKKEKEQEK